VFSAMDALVQGFRSIGLQNWDSLLSNNRSGIDSSIDIMDRTAGDLYAIIKGLFPCLQTRKGRQQRRVNINNPILEIPQKLSFQDPHKPRQDDQVDLSLPKGADIGLLGGFFEFCAKFTRVDELRWNLEFCGPLQDGRVSHVA